MNLYSATQGRHASSLVTTEKDSSSGIAVLSLNRPPANAFSLPFMQEIIATVKDCEGDSAVQGIVMATTHKSIFRESLVFPPDYALTRELMKHVNKMSQNTVCKPESHH